MSANHERVWDQGKLKENFEIIGAQVGPLAFQLIDDLEKFEANYHLVFIMIAQGISPEELSKSTFVDNYKIELDSVLSTIEKYRSQAQRADEAFSQLRAVRKQVNELLESSELTIDELMQLNLDRPTWNPAHFYAWWSQRLHGKELVVNNVHFKIDDVNEYGISINHDNPAFKHPIPQSQLSSVLQQLVHQTSQKTAPASAGYSQQDAPIQLHKDFELTFTALSEGKEVNFPSKDFVRFHEYAADRLRQETIPIENLYKNKLTFKQKFANHEYAFKVGGYNEVIDGGRTRQQLAVYDYSDLTQTSLIDISESFHEHLIAFARLRYRETFIAELNWLIEELHRNGIDPYASNIAKLPDFIALVKRDLTIDAEKLENWVITKENWVKLDVNAQKKAKALFDHHKSDLEFYFKYVRRNVHETKDQHQHATTSNNLSGAQEGLTRDEKKIVIDWNKQSDRFNKLYKGDDLSFDRDSYTRYGKIILKSGVPGPFRSVSVNRNFYAVPIQSYNWDGQAFEREDHLIIKCLNPTVTGRAILLRPARIRVGATGYELVMPGEMKIIQE